jgi:DNA-binding transcriptional LysR family regulator
MELRHLRYFVAVAEELHVGRAAARLHIAQPPLSRQIRDLEREVGTPLFDRVPRGVELTPAGRAFLGEARLVLAQAERALRTAQRAARGEVGRLRVAFAEAATYAGVLPDVLGFFRMHLPNIGLSLFELDSPQQWEALREGRVDVGLLHALPADAARWLVTEPVLADPLVAALPQGHRLAAPRGTRAAGRLALVSLAGEPLVFAPRPGNPELHDAVVARCRDAGFGPTVVQEAAGWHTLVGLAAAGVGIALVPQSLARLERPGVVYRELRGLGAALTMTAAWRRGDRQPVRERFVTSLRVVARARGAGARGR